MMVSQRARDAAADAILSEGDNVRESDVRKIRQGFRDNDPLVQAFAAFEAQAEARGRRGQGRALLAQCFRPASYNRIPIC